MMKKLKLKQLKGGMDMVNSKKNQFFFFLLSFLLIQCNHPIYRKDSMRELKNNFNENKDFFENIENSFFQNIDSINEIYNNFDTLNNLDKKTGIFFMNIDFLKGKKSNNIYISTGTNDCSGYMYFSKEEELNNIFLYIDSLIKIDPSIHLKVEKLDKNWVSYSKNKEAPLDILFYNNINL